LHRHLEEQAKELENLREKFKQTRAESLTDFLTGIANRKSFDQTIRKSIKKARREKKALCLLLLDVDHFKIFNDRHGHIIGDQILKFVARKIRENIRGRDYAARYGGEEFAIILPDTTLDGAKSVAENIRLFFHQAKLKTTSGDKQLGSITVSIGVSQCHDDDSVEGFIQRSDKALYYAKENGRNMVGIETDLTTRSLN
jgi:diguanylate cyclase